MALPRKLRRRTPLAGPKPPKNLHDYTNRVAPRRASRRSREDDGPINVTDDWPEQVPLGRIEVSVRQDKIFAAAPDVGLPPISLFSPTERTP
jgi:hypothetical protein